MILKRKIYKKLLEWKNECQGKKALLIEGARRIGKSTICEEFGKNEYESYLLIDFAKKDKEVEMYFERYLNDLDTFFMLLQTHFGTKLTERNSLFLRTSPGGVTFRKTDISLDAYNTGSRRMQYPVYVCGTWKRCGPGEYTS